MTSKPKYLSDVTINDARILFRNFSGEERQYNAKGQRNFSVVIPAEHVDAMIDDGWNIKFLKPRDADELPLPYLQVKVRFDSGRPPRTVMVTSRGRTTLGEDLVGAFDYADIAKVDLIIHPSRWEVNGNAGVAAYLKTMFLTINEDELELKYAMVPEIEMANNQLELTSGEGFEDLGEVEEQHAIASGW